MNTTAHEKPNYMQNVYNYNFRNNIFKLPKLVRIIFVHYDIFRQGATQFWFDAIQDFRKKYLVNKEASKNEIYIQLSEMSENK